MKQKLKDVVVRLGLTLVVLPAMLVQEIARRLGKRREEPEASAPKRRARAAQPAQAKPETQATGAAPRRRRAANAVPAAAERQERGEAPHRRRITISAPVRAAKPGAMRRKSRRHYTVSDTRIDLNLLLRIALGAVAVVSACMVLSIVGRMLRTRSVNSELAALHAHGDVQAASAVLTPEPTAMAQPTPQPTLQPAAAASEAAPATAEPNAAPTPVPMGKRAYQQVGGEALSHMAALYEKNRDLVGWLTIENVLDLPVVYRDNDYYLKRDFYKQKNTAGTIFLDENHPFKEKTQNLLLHGHNMKDGTMFGRLLQYETDLDYVRWHPFVRFDTLWRREEYVIFAVLRVSLDTKSKEFFNYFTHPTFASDAAAQAYIRNLQLRSLYAIPIDVQPTDALLTLSTCLDEDRLVIVARRVRNGETHTGLRTITSTAVRQ